MRVHSAAGASQYGNFLEVGLHPQLATLEWLDSVNTHRKGPITAMHIYEGPDSIFTHMLQDVIHVARSSQMSQNVTDVCDIIGLSRCHKMSQMPATSQGLCRCHMTSQGLPRCHKMSQMFATSQASPYVTRSPQMSQDVADASDVTGPPQMSQIVADKA